jgi:hypothetical protein
MGLERGPLSLVSTIEELLGRKSSGSGLESREFNHRDLSRWPRGTLYPQTFAPTSPTSGDRSVSIVRSLTQATELSLYFVESTEQDLSSSGCLGANVCTHWWKSKLLDFCWKCVQGSHKKTSVFCLGNMTLLWNSDCIKSKKESNVIPVTGRGGL